MSDTIMGSAMLDMADKMIPFLTKINDYRYFLAEGGRGGGKSQAIARILIYYASQYKLRIVCGRETQNSIAESVYSVFADVIRKYDLNFTIQTTKIINNNTGTEINFRGFREQGAFNIQGMEGVDILWIDEAQAITKQTLDVLIPTIRKDSAKIYFSMNRHVVDDPVYERFHSRKDCLHVNINYYENKFCTEALKNEAEECRSYSEDDYNHIWLGKPLDKSEDAVFSFEELEATRENKSILHQGYGLKIGAFDIARYGDDKCACVGIQQLGSLKWRVCYTNQWGKKDLNYTTGRILMLTNEQGFEKAAIDEDGIGSGPLDTLNHGRGLDQFVGFRNPPVGYKDDKYYGNVRTANVYKLKDMVLKGNIEIDDDELIRELCTLRYKFDNYQRRILISKKEMKEKYKIKSPNLADSLIMAVSLIGTIEYEQTRMYQTTNFQVPESNLFQLAGVR